MQKSNKTKLNIINGVLLFLILPFFLANNLQNWDDAIEKTQKETFRVETFSEGFDVPWGMAFLPNKDLIVSDRNGNLWRIEYKSKIKT